MRTPNNDTPGVTAKTDSSSASGQGSEPLRTCILSRAESPREGLVRLALSPDGEVLPDVRAKAPGRGAWIGVDRTELEAAQAKGKLRGTLSRAFKTQDLRIPDDLGARIETQLQRNLLDRLGLESKAGHVTIGGEKLDKAARSGKLHLLLHASDAGQDGAGKLAQAWRVGSDMEGSGRKGVTLPLPRTILSLALGRENVVHAGIIDAKAAKRVSEALDRWLHFIGPDPAPRPCETGPQGASAFPPDGSPTMTNSTEGL